MARRPVTRNWAARSPLLTKGGVHQESNSARRHQLARQLEAELLEWHEDQPAETGYESELNREEDG